MTTLVLGATRATGRNLVQQLLQMGAFFLTDIQANICSADLQIIERIKG